MECDSEMMELYQGELASLQALSAEGETIALPDHLGLQEHTCAETGGPVTAVGGVAICNLEEFEYWAGEQDDHVRLIEEVLGGETIGTLPASEGFSPQVARISSGITVADIVAAAADGAPIFPNLVYFPRSNYTFHPGTVPIPGTKPLSGQEFDAAGRVLTLDSGLCGQTGLLFASAVAHQDGFPTGEVVRGHGPAIADYVGRLLGHNEDAQRSFLMSIDHSKTAWSLAMNATAYATINVDVNGTTQPVAALTRWHCMRLFKAPLPLPEGSKQAWSTSRWGH